MTRSQRRSPGEGKVKKLGPGKYQVGIPVPTDSGKTGYKTRIVYSDSRAAHNKALADLRKQWEGRASTRWKVKDYAAHWLQHRKPRVRPNTYAREATVCRMVVIPMLGHLWLDAVTTAQIDTTLTKLLQQGYKTSTVHTIKVQIGMMFRQATRWKFVVSNPFDDVEKITVTPTAHTVWTIEQAQHVLATCEDVTLKLLIWLGLMGMRSGEIRGLYRDNIVRWRDVAADQEVIGEITITKTINRLNDVWYVGEPKTPKSRRSLPLTRDLDVLIDEQFAVQKQQREQGGAAWLHKMEGDPIITSPRGGYYYSLTFQRKLDALTARVNVPRITLHELRHTATTLLMQARNDARTVMVLLGQSTFDMNLHYTHTNRERVQSVGSELQRRMRGTERGAS